MPPKEVKCKECGWEGTTDALETYKCPKCGSRRLKSEGSRMSKKENLNPPEGANQGDDMEGWDFE